MLGGFMADAVTLLERDSLEDRPSSPSRAELLARYRRLREISRHHHREVLNFISQDAILQHARRLGLARGKTLLLDDPDELNYAFDLAIHTAPAERSRAIDRYARSAPAAPGSDETLMLDAMRAARFSILRIDRRHDVAGLITTDLCRQTEGWLVDIGFESSVPDGSVIATRLYTPDRFSMTAGINVPLDVGIIGSLAIELPHHMKRKPMAAIIDYRRFAETLYRAALANGVLERTS